MIGAPRVAREYRVVILPAAEADLEAIDDWISEQAGQDVAARYLDRVRRRFAALTSFPLRGTPRDDLHPSLRTLPFERRLLIVYEVADGEVLIRRVLSAVRDLQRVVL